MHDREGFTAVPERRLRQLQAKAIAATGLASRVSVATVVGPATKTSSVVVASRA